MLESSDRNGLHGPWMSPECSGKSSPTYVPRLVEEEENHTETLSILGSSPERLFPVIITLLLNDYIFLPESYTLYIPDATSISIQRYYGSPIVLSGTTKDTKDILELAGGLREVREDELDDLPDILLKGAHRELFRVLGRLKPSKPPIPRSNVHHGVSTPLLTRDQAHR